MIIKHPLSSNKCNLSGLVFDCISLVLLRCGLILQHMAHAVARISFFLLLSVWFKLLYQIPTFQVANLR